MPTIRLYHKALIATALTASLSILSGCKSLNNHSELVQLGKGVASEAGYSKQVSAADAVLETINNASNAASIVMGKPGSYNIPLPEELRAIEPTLQKLGLGSATEQLKSYMNDAASKAAAEASPYFKQAARNLTITDAAGIALGGDTSITNYFRGQTETSLASQLQPVVQSKLKATGFYDQYKTILDVYNKVPLVKKPNLDIEKYVVGETLTGLYEQMGEQEKSIRKDPNKAGSALLQQILVKPK